jgi:hypothetical protein
MDHSFYRHIELQKDLSIITTILDENGISYEVDSAKTIIDENIVGSPLFAKYTLKLKPKDFELANQKIEQYYAQVITDHDGFEHLSQLTNEELIDIIIRPEEWSIESSVAAKLILRDRNIIMSDEDIANKRKQHQSALRKGEKANLALRLSCILAIFIGLALNLVFAIGGLSFSYYLAYGTKKDSNGVSYFIYDMPSRKQGMWIFYGGIIAFSIEFYYIHYFLSR